MSIWHKARTAMTKPCVQVHTRVKQDNAGPTESPAQRRHFTNASSPSFFLKDDISLAFTKQIYAIPANFSRNKEHVSLVKNQSASSLKQLWEPLRHHTGRWQVSPVSVQAEPLGYTSLYREVYYNAFFVMIMEVGKSAVSKLESQAVLTFQLEFQGRKS